MASLNFTIFIFLSSILFIYLFFYFFRLSCYCKMHIFKASNWNFKFQDFSGPWEPWIKWFLLPSQTLVVQSIIVGISPETTAKRMRQLSGSGDKRALTYLTGQFQVIAGAVKISIDIDFLLIQWSVCNPVINEKKVISKILVDSNISFTSYAWLCALICSIDYCVK